MSFNIFQLLKLMNNQSGIYSIAIYKREAMKGYSDINLWIITAGSKLKFNFEKVGQIESLVVVAILYVQYIVKICDLIPVGKLVLV